METTVVNLKGRKPQALKEGEVYCGRAINMGGWKLSGSIFCNPYKVGKDGTLDEVLKLYEEYIKGNRVIQRHLPELKGKRLACWCKPNPCHCDILKRYVDLL